MIIAGTYYWHSSVTFPDGSQGSGYLDKGLRCGLLAMADASGAVNYVFYDQDAARTIPLGADPFTSRVSLITGGYGDNDDGGDKGVVTGFYDVNGAPIYVPGCWGNQDGFLYWDPGHHGANGLGGSGNWTNGGDADWYSPQEGRDVAWDTPAAIPPSFRGPQAPST